MANVAARALVRRACALGQLPFELLRDRGERRARGAIDFGEALVALHHVPRQIAGCARAKSR